MGRHPTVAADNIFCIYRKNAAKYNDKLNSREGAAEEIGISVSQLKDYELGVTKIVPVESIMRMADLYNAPELKNYYCRHYCPLGENVPELEIDKGLDRITVKAMSALRRLKDTEDALLDITEDGAITKEEVPKLREIIGLLDEFSAIGQNFRAWIEKHGDR